jgi:hypothetical protein
LFVFRPHGGRKALKGWLFCTVLAGAFPVLRPIKFL